MKTIYLLRHAKSDWDADYGSDHDRPLNRRGSSAAPLMGRFLRDLDQVPDAVLCSTARRARDTLDLAARAGSWTSPVEHTADLYEASPESVLELIQRQDDAHASLLLVGHEPTWSLLAGELAGGARIRMPTGALVRVDTAGDCWSSVQLGGGMLVWLVTPKLLAGLGYG